jgi:hypothetical protein
VALERTKTHDKSEGLPTRSIDDGGRIMQEIPGASGSFPEGVPKISPDNKLKPRHYLYLFRFSVLLLLLPFTRYNGCLATNADQQEAVQLETVMHQEMTKGDVLKIYMDSDSFFQKAVTLAHHQAYLGAVAKTYGNPLDCTSVETAVRYGFGTKSIRSKCVTNFSGGKSAIESFTWNKTDGGYQLHYYAIKGN